MLLERNTAFHLVRGKSQKQRVKGFLIVIEQLLQALTKANVVYLQRVQMLRKKMERYSKHLHSVDLNVGLIHL